MFKEEIRKRYNSIKPLLLVDLFINFLCITVADENSIYFFGVKFVVVNTFSSLTLVETNGRTSRKAVRDGDGGTLLSW